MRRSASNFRESRVWEVGCGTGVLLAVASQLGSAQLFGTDLDPRALELTRQTATANSFEAETAVVDLMHDPPWQLPCDVLVALLPQKPCVDGSLPMANDGGPEGSNLISTFLEQSGRWLDRQGCLFLFVHSLCHPEALVKLHQQYEATLLSIKKRVFSPDSFSTIYSDLLRRREAGTAYFEDLEDGRHAFVCMAFRAGNPKPQIPDPSR